MSLINKFRSEYSSFCNAKNRCTYPSHEAFHRYGGAGITFHDGWSGRGGFARFLAHIGPKPTPNHTLDRIKGDRGYEPGNVRWATRTEQARNRSNAVTSPTELDRLHALADVFGAPRSLVQTRYYSGKRTLYGLCSKANRTARVEARHASVIAMAEEGASYRSIASELGLTQSAVSRIARGWL